MWGRAAQVVVTVIALVLVRPESARHEPAMARFVAAGHAFAPYPTSRAGVGASVPRRRTRQTNVRVVSAPAAVTATRTALIIGIDHARGTRSLPGAVTDAMNLRAALRGYGFRDDNVQMLLEGQATRPAILGALRDLASRTPRDGTAVFAIATHTQRSRGTNLLATAEGSRISATELAQHLRAVRAPMWVALPTCYAAGYARPGIVGRRRIATFASAADREAYQAGKSGSFLFIHMVRRAMLEQRSPASVESAFAFARSEIVRSYPEYVPSISDGIPGDLVLGPIRRRATTRSDAEIANEQREARASPAPTSGPRGRSGVVVCGRVRYNCS